MARLNHTRPVPYGSGVDSPLGKAHWDCPRPIGSQLRYTHPPPPRNNEGRGRSWKSGPGRARPPHRPRSRHPPSRRPPSSPRGRTWSSTLCTPARGQRPPFPGSSSTTTRAMQQVRTDVNLLDHGGCGGVTPYRFRRSVFGGLEKVSTYHRQDGEGEGRVKGMCFLGPLTGSAR
jgi:hypothetical protein